MPRIVPYDVVQRMRAFLFGRAGAYRRVFTAQSFDARMVLADLAKFCRAHASTGSKDALVQARLDGRREVWLRLQHHLKLDDETLWSIYGGDVQPSTPKQEQ